MAEVRRAAAVIALALLAACAASDSNVGAPHAFGGPPPPAPTPLPAARLAFGAISERQFQSGNIVLWPVVTVVVQDSNGAVVTSAADRITIGIRYGKDDLSRYMIGTTSMDAFSGIATFHDVRLDWSRYPFLTSEPLYFTAIASGLLSATVEVHFF